MAQTCLVHLKPNVSHSISERMKKISPAMEGSTFSSHIPVNHMKHTVLWPMHLAIGYITPITNAEAAAETKALDF